MEKNGNINYLTKLEVILKYKKLKESRYARTSEIYRYSDNELLKLFYFNREHEKEKYLVFQNLQLNNFANPKKLLYLRGLLYGYIMDKKDGTMLKHSNDNIVLKDFISKIDKVTSDIHLLTSNRIYLTDLHDENILYDDKNNEINIIDMDEYFFSRESRTFEELYPQNIKTFYKSILNFFSNHNVVYKTKIYSNLIEIINRELTKSNYDGESIFTSIIDELQNIEDIQINTLSDFRQTVKKISLKEPYN